MPLSQNLNAAKLENIIKSVPLTWVGNKFLKCEVPVNAEILDFIQVDNLEIRAIYEESPSGVIALTHQWFRVCLDSEKIDQDYPRLVKTFYDKINKRLVHLLSR